MRGTSSCRQYRRSSQSQIHIWICGRPIANAISSRDFLLAPVTPHFTRGNEIAPDTDRRKSPLLPDLALAKRPLRKLCNEYARLAVSCVCLVRSHGARSILCVQRVSGLSKSRNWCSKSMRMRILYSEKFPY